MKIIKIDNRSLKQRFFSSVMKNNLEEVISCVKSGANIRANNDQALGHACLYGYLEIVKYLIENGANIHACNNEPLRLACYNRNYEVIQYLRNIINEDNNN